MKKECVWERKRERDSPPTGWLSQLVRYSSSQPFQQKTTEQASSFRQVNWPMEQQVSLQLYKKKIICQPTSKAFFLRILFTNWLKKN